MSSDPVSTRFTHSTSLYNFYTPAPHELSQWVRTEYDVPGEGAVVPIWDGEFLYYGIYWKKEGLDFWVISENMHVNPDDMHLRKKLGEKIQPIQWLKIEAPTL